MQTIAAQLTDVRRALSAVAGDAAAIEARALAARAWGMSPEALIRDSESLRAPEPLTLLVNRRLQHEPVSQILGQKDFWKDSFIVTRDVLTPRADSETMIETLLQLRPDMAAKLQFVDLGTGSGCLLLSSLREYPAAQGIGLDQSDAALAIATKNAAALGLSERTRFMRSNWCSNLDVKADVVLANPPYIPAADMAGLAPDVRDHEPHTALTDGADGLDCYRSICAQLSPHLNPGALVLFEVGQGQAADVAALGQAQGWKLIQRTADLAGIDRVVALQTRD